MKIIHLLHDKIDRHRWDEAITASTNTMPYAFSWYLDAVCPGWEALVADDYNYVMPLPVKCKWGVKYLITPRWTQQLGLFSDREADDVVLRRFIRAIPYFFYDFNINYANVGEGRVAAADKTNYVISAEGGMQAVRRRYDENTRRSVERARGYNFEIDDELEVEDFVRLWQAVNEDKADELHKKLPQLAFAAEDNRCGIFVGIYSEDEPIAAAFAVRAKDRLVFLAPVSTRRGKEKCAMFLIVDYLIKEWCCRYGLLFDCEGSMLPGVARFYRGFGPKKQNYGSIRRGRPDWLVRLLSIVK